ncbi:hypothetical protein THAOC_18225, partial [Thalassiosira oceanica]
WKRKQRGPPYDEAASAILCVSAEREEPASVADSVRVDKNPRGVLGRVRHKSCRAHPQPKEPMGKSSAFTGGKLSLKGDKKRKKKSTKKSSSGKHRIDDGETKGGRRGRTEAERRRPRRRRGGADRGRAPVEEVQAEEGEGGDGGGRQAQPQGEGGAVQREAGEADGAQRHPEGVGSRKRIIGPRGGIFIITRAEGEGNVLASRILRWDMWGF